MSVTWYRPGGMRFEETYEDELLGTLHARDEVTRDLDFRIRRADDLGDIDRDWLLEGWFPRVERDLDPL